MLSQYIETLDLVYISEEKNYHSYEIGFHVKFMEDDIYDFSEYDIILLGVKEGRAAGMKNLSCDMAPDEIRKDLFRLNIPNPLPRILDLGNLRDAEEVTDTYEYLETVLSFLYTQNKPIVILGGSQDLTVPQFKGLASVKDDVNLAIVDERIDLNNSVEITSSDAFLQMIMKSNQPQLNHLTIFGYQSYFTNYNVLDVINSMSYETVRLGQARYNIPQYNHIFRIADVVSIDVSVIKQSDAPGRSMQSPNGLQSDELCQITRYCAMNPHLKSIGFYEVNPQFDIRHLTTQMVAHAIWYFIEGYTYRMLDKPFDDTDENEFDIYLVEFTEVDSRPFHFYQHKQTKNWWVELPTDASETKKIFPCGADDYRDAVNGEISTWVFNLIARNQ